MLLLLLFVSLRRRQFSNWLIASLLLAEIFSVNIVLAFNGGATNPFGSILLVPVVLAFMLLPLRLSSALVAISIGCQAAQLLFPGETGHVGHVMQSHYHGMVMSFAFSSLLIGVVVLYFKRQLSLHEEQLQLQREQQMRNEQLLAIGTAAAQLTHDVATPVQTIKLLLEEAEESSSPPPWLSDLLIEFSRVENQLSEWREIANDVRAKKLHAFSLTFLHDQLKSILLNARPETQVSWEISPSTEYTITADRTVLPALSSILINACDASPEGSAAPIQVSSSVTEQHWLLRVSNPTSIDEDTLNLLGRQIVPSAEGHGVGAIVSNATIERFNGRVQWTLTGNILTTEIRLPVNAPCTY